MDKLEILIRVEPLLPPTNALEVMMTSYFLDSLNHISKTQHCIVAPFSTTMETIYNQPLPDAWSHIYTDVSKLDVKGVAGAGIFYQHLTYYLFLGTNKTIFDGVVEAIKVALIHLKAHPFLNILTYSQTLKQQY
ncbi:hypothetical protein TNCT_732121 [Trichonephila clavata]|uniref:Uncharacterized protein n=1 Tax=Trichonephila clavata TaxID=2740835 RepID=A0A8X6JPM2_TRICU|nr:hypothetical protein TNCT_732121 [Trichonephila clavata]